MFEIQFIRSVLQVLVASSIFFVWVVRYNNIVKEFIDYRLPDWLRDLVGILKISFAMMLLVGIDSIKFAIFGAAGLAVLMGAALLTHIRVRNPVHKTFPSFCLLTASVIILMFAQP